MREPLSHLFTVILLSLTLGPAAWASESRPVKIRGRLSDAQGEPLSGHASLEFVILDLDRGGEVVWKEIRDIRARSGEYEAELGGTNPLPPMDCVRRGWRLAVYHHVAGWPVGQLSLRRPLDPRRTRINGLLEKLGVDRDQLEEEPSAELLGLLGLHPSASPMKETAKFTPPPETAQKDLELYGYGTRNAPLPPRIAYDGDEDVSVEKIRQADKVIRREEALLRKRLAQIVQDLKDRPSEAKAPPIPITVSALPR